MHNHQPVIVIEPTTARVYRVRYRRGDILFVKRIKRSGIFLELDNFDWRSVVRFKHYNTDNDIKLSYIRDLRLMLIGQLSEELDLVEKQEFGDLSHPHPLVIEKARNDFQKTKIRAIKDISNMISDLG